MDAWFRFVELILTIVPGTVECERAFYLKNDSRNRLAGENLCNSVAMMTQTDFTIHTFPFAAALRAWAVAKKYRWKDTRAAPKARKQAKGKTAGKAGGATAEPMQLD